GYKVGAAASPAPGQLRDRLQAAGRLDGAVIGARLGLDGELIVPAEQVLTEDQPLPYLSTLIVPALRASAVGSGLSAQSSDTRAATEPSGTPTPAVIPPSNHRDVTLRSSERPRCDVAVGESSDESSPRGDSSQRQGRVVFVGAGPGAPDLITERGARAIKEADIVIWASSLVDHRIVADHARPGAEIVDSAQLSMEQVLPYYERAAHNKITVARVHSGDPSLWGAIQEQLEQCHELGLDTEVIPGVSSFSAVAAAIQRE